MPSVIDLAQAASTVELRPAVGIVGSTARRTCRVPNDVELHADLIRYPVERLVNPASKLVGGQGEPFHEGEAGALGTTRATATRRFDSNVSSVCLR
jgi:hypothetical protein